MRQTLIIICSAALPHLSHREKKNPLHLLLAAETLPPSALTPAYNQTKPNQEIMKKLTIAFFASIALAATSFAGHEVVSSGKEYKGNPVPPVTCFQDQELQLDVFGAFQIGEGPDHAGPIHDHGWGGGVGINYFFSRYIGIGAEGYWIYADHNAATPGDDNGKTIFHNLGGSLIFRLPIDEMCLAPYAFVGGGAVLDSEQWAVAFAGVGVEYRVVPNKVGLFIDGRFNYF